LLLCSYSISNGTDGLNETNKTHNYKYSTEDIKLGLLVLYIRKLCLYQ